MKGIADGGSEQPLLLTALLHHPPDGKNDSGRVELVAAVSPSRLLVLNVPGLTLDRV